MSDKIIQITEMNKWFGDFSSFKKYKFRSRKE